MKQYSRDYRSPIPKDGNVSRVMSANKAKNTKLELTLRRYLWKGGIRGYRVNYKRAPGRPDICFVGKKVAIFVHGCFWHHCPHCSTRLPKHNREFWEEKFTRNKARDEKKIRELTEMGWTTFVVWECQMRKGLEGVVEKIRLLLE